MGAVYLAEQPGLNRRVAVKVLLSALANDPDFTKRFKREAMLAEHQPPRPCAGVCRR
jgi:serine/threonine protein kinase